MGQQVSKRPVKQKSWKEQARIQGLYEMYTESMRLSRLIESQSVIGQLSSQQNKKSIQQQQNNKKPKHKNRKSSYNSNNNTNQRTPQQSRKFLQQLLQSFELREEFIWAEEIPQLFRKHFSQEFEEKWQQSKEFFYELLLENVGVEVDGEVGKSRIGVSRLVIDNNNNNGGNAFKKGHINNISIGQTSLPKLETMNISSFQEYFHKVIIKQRDSMNIRSSFMVNDDQIDRRKEEQIAEVQSQRMTLEEEINFINSSIIDEEFEGEDKEGQGVRKSGHKIDNNTANVSDRNNNSDNPLHLLHQTDDDQYFLPLITKRHKQRTQDKRSKSKKLADRISQYSSQSSCLQHEIQMSHLPSAVKYSKVRLEAASVILPSTIFYQRMNFSAKVETDQSLKIYRQLSNTIQQTINSCNLISCPLKHFLLYFEFKTSKKKINQHHHDSHSSLIVSNSINNKSNSKAQQKQLGVNSNKLILSKHHSESPTLSPPSATITRQQHIINMSLAAESNQSLSLSQPKSQMMISHISTTSHETINEQLYQILIQVSQKSEFIRKKRQFNTNYLLKQVKDFTQSYTEFLYKYLNFNKIQQTDLSTFINLDTVYGVVLRNIWSIVNWIAGRGYEWEEFALVEIVNQENPQFQFFTEAQIEDNPSVILRKYATFCNKDVRKMKTDPIKLCKAYKSLLKLKNEIFPQKYLKKIIIFYRQATKCCQGADELMTLYEFLLKNCVLNNLTQQMHIFRMKNIIEKLIPIESSSIEGAGEIVYAWTTWNIMLEMFSIKLKEYKMVLLAESERVEMQSCSRSNNVNDNAKNKLHHHQTQRKHQYQHQALSSTSSTTKRKQTTNIQSNHQNPERRVDRKLQFTLTNCHQIQQ